MISVVIATFNNERTLGPALAALIAAAIDGQVREVVVVDAGSTDHTLEIADDAGARIFKASESEGARIARGCTLARGDWLMILDPQAIPPAGWDAAVKGHVREQPGQAAWWSSRPQGLAFWRAAEPDAVLVPRRLYDEVGGYGPGFVGRLGRRAKRLKFGR
jgi:glycosyltransferase involved in cell wall biosynthesis